MAAPMRGVRLTLKLLKCVQNDIFRRHMHVVRPFIYGGRSPLFPEERKLIRDEIPIGHRFTGTPVEKSLTEILEEREGENSRFQEPPVNIGIDYSISRQTRQHEVDGDQSELEHLARHRKLKIPLEEQKNRWEKEFGPIHKKDVAEHYGIYKDLFGNAFFYPVTKLEIAYDFDEDLVTPVYRGNVIPPSDAACTPNVQFDADKDTWWTLLMTNPDGHLTDQDGEYLHWMVGNIPGGDISQGEELCSYLQPFPPRGSGYHRHVFLLFKQEKRLDLSTEKRDEVCTNLSQRTFKTFDFYRKFEDDLTPMGLSFFQSCWDNSVQAVYHNVLDMQAPEFEYEHVTPYHPPQKSYPHRQPFDRYFDRYRDRKDIAEEVLKMKLEMISPFREYKPEQKYPLVHLASSRKATWMKRRDNLMHRRKEQFKDLPL